MRPGRGTLAALVLVPVAASAGEAHVIDARAIPEGDGRYRVEVTVRHDDTGWDHYVDRWEVLNATGEVLGTRVLHHPHVDEQPFTRSLSGVSIPAGTERVRIRARDSVHGFGGDVITLRLR